MKNITWRRDFERDGTHAMLNDFEDIPCMKPLIFRSLMWAGMLAVTTVFPAFAQTTAPAEVEVSGVKFNAIRQANSQSVWYETDIELTTKPAPENGKFTGRVKVTLNLGIEAPAPGGKKQINFYRSSAELVALDAGKCDVRFYLPPEIVKRDMIRGEAKFYLIELSVGGKTLQTTKADVSFSTLNTAALLEGFRSKISSDGAANDGILLPQYLTPYIFDSSRPTPSFVRLENAH